MRIDDDRTKPVLVHSTRLDWVASPGSNRSAVGCSCNGKLDRRHRTVT